MADASGTPDPDPTHTAELRLEPVGFIARTDAVLRLGALMLGAGASSARVSDSMARAARAVGIEELHSRVGMKDIVSTASRGQMFRTRVAEIRTPAVDADRLTALKRLTNDLRPGMTAAAVQERLDGIERMPRRYSSVLRVVAAALACAAFALLNNGGWQEFVAVGIAAGTGQAVRMTIHRLRINEFLVVFASAITALLVYLLVAQLFTLLGLPGVNTTRHSRARCSSSCRASRWSRARSTSHAST